MKRVLEVVAITLLVAGTELATGAVSHGLDQLRLVLSQLIAGTEPEASPLRFFFGLALFAVGTGLLLLSLWARAYSGFMNRDKNCPHCGTRAERVKRRKRHKVLSWILGEVVTNRKCRTCGWHGLAGIG